MAAKYDVGLRWRYRQKHNNPILSRHVVMAGDGNDRWDERMPAASRSPEWVLTRAEYVEGGSDLPAFDRAERIRLADCVALDGTAYRPVFVIRDNTVVTVLPVRDLQHAPSRVYLHTVADQQDTIGGAE